jgi:tripartite-type tricarboxylate transporter receptor subunit TctC
MNNNRSLALFLLITKLFLAIISIELLCLNVPLKARAAEFYRGQTISFIVSSAAGGSYDLMSRTIATYLPRYIPGQPTVVVKNLPGAGGIAAANQLFGNSPRDGTVMGGLQGNIPFEPMLGVKEAKFDPREFIWLGTPSTETCVLTVWAEAGVRSIEELKNKSLNVASTGVNSNPSVSARLLGEIFGTKMQPIVGYTGLANALLAIEKREVDGHACILWAAIQALRPQWIAENKTRFLLQWGAIKEKGLPETPFAMDLITNSDDRLLLEAASAPLALGRPFLLPPGVPADRVKVMQDAMMSVFDDVNFRADAARLQLEINAPRTGAEVAQLIDRVYNMPNEVIIRLRRLSIQ